MTTRRRRVRDRVKARKARSKWRETLGRFVPRGEAKVARFVYPNGPSIRGMMERGQWYRVEYLSYEPPRVEDGGMRWHMADLRMEKL